MEKYRGVPIVPEAALEFARELYSHYKIEFDDYDFDYDDIQRFLTESNELSYADYKPHIAPVYLISARGLIGEQSVRLVNPEIKDANGNVLTFCYHLARPSQNNLGNGRYGLTECSTGTLAMRSDNPRKLIDFVMDWHTATNDIHVRMLNTMQRRLPELRNIYNFFYAVQERRNNIAGNYYASVWGKIDNQPVRIGVNTTLTEFKLEYFDMISELVYQQLPEYVHIDEIHLFFDKDESEAELLPILICKRSW